MQKPAISTAVPRDSAAKTFSIVFFFIALKAAGNYSLAWGMKHFSEPASANPLHYLKAMLEPAVAAGVILLIVSLLTRMALLSLADLSFILPVTAIGYILAALIGRYFLNEVVTPQRWLGTILIALGAALVGSTTQSTTPFKEDGAQ